MTFGDDDFERIEAASDEYERRFRYADREDLLPIMDLAALAKTKAKPVEFAIEGIAPVGEVTLFTGAGMAGKSLLSQQLATSAVAGLSCLGLKVRRGPALYLTCEDGTEILHWRQERLCEALGLRFDTLAAGLHLISLRGRLGNELESKDDTGACTPSATYRLLSATVRETGAKLVFLDNVAHLFAGKEIERHEVTRFINLLNRLAGTTGAAILLLGHPNKSGDPYSGSTAWLNAVRSHVWIDYVKDSSGTVIDRDARVLKMGKANYAPVGDPIEFRYHNGAYILPDDLPADTRAELSEVIAASGENEAFLACLRERSSQGDARAVGPKPGPNYAPAQFEGMPAARGHDRHALKRAMERLFSIGRIEIVKVENKAKGREISIIREVTAHFPNRFPNSSRTPSPDSPEPHPNEPPTHTPSLWEGGAALEAAAPPPSERT
jgi:RecA-family ATPase